ncbi:hypothetical protein [Saccharopolyspora hattusasensis]|uniref:hypothetical protein n=1 Tax=Saccharopolyspora hattusasensis TaxID=1128679 RepID=UPI003D980710
MEGQFGVDLDALVSAAVGVQTLMDELAKQDINDVDPDPIVVGHDGLADTLRDFCDRWDHGVFYLIKDGEELAKRLDETAGEYLRIDLGIAENLNGN